MLRLSPPLTNVITYRQIAFQFSEAAPFAELELIRTGDLQNPSSIEFQTVNGDAVAGSDYVGTNGTVQFASGTATQTVAVPLINDGLAETNESFVVELHSPSNALMGVSGIARITIVDSGSPPTIVQHPTDTSFEHGGTFQLSVSVSGNGPFSYQWRQDGTVLSNLTAATATLTNASYADAGSYDVIVSNLGGNVTSSAAEVSMMEEVTLAQIAQWPAYQRSGWIPSMAVSGQTIFAAANAVSYTHLTLPTKRIV